VTPPLIAVTNWLTAFGPLVTERGVGKVPPFDPMMALPLESLPFAVVLEM